METANKGSNCGRNRYVCFGSLAVECGISGMSASPTFRGCRPHAQAQKSRFLCRGSPPGKLKVLDDGMQAARLGSVSHAVTSPGLPVASDSAARGALASS